MSDSSYSVEIKLVPQYLDNGEKRWFTPEQSNAYYSTRYARNGITVHHWGDGGAGSHDGTVAFFQRRQDGGSVNYVVSDSKITLMVSPDNVAFCSQSGNPTTVSIEHQTFLGAEGYKKSGWLVNQLEQRYGKTLTLYPHNKWFATACPGSIDINRIRAEADKWKSGAYDAKPTPVVVPPAPKPTPAPAPTPTVTLSIKDVPNKKVQMIRDTSLWNLQFVKHTSAQAIKPILMKETNADGGYEVSAYVTHPTGSKYYISEYSYAKGLPMGINVKDTNYPDPEALHVPISVPPVVIEVPVVKPVPVEAPVVVVDPTKAVEQRLTAIEKFLQTLGFK